MKSCLLKGIIAFSSLVLIAMAVVYFFYHESKPTGKAGPEAEQLTQKMFDAINEEAWQTVEYISWNFADRQQYIWDRKRNLVQVKWSGAEVLLNPKDMSGIAIAEGKKVEGEKTKEFLKKAWDLFNNDSFWLNAPAMAKHPGTSRSVVTTENGEKQLMVTYTSGGTTPGDSYLWKLDKNGRPVSYKMWVKIIPVGGMEFTWEGWKDIGNGAMLSSTHVSSLFTLQLTDIKIGNSYTDFGFDSDPFAEIVRNNNIPTSQPIEGLTPTTQPNEELVPTSQPMLNK